MKRILHGYKMAYGDHTNIWTFTVYEWNGKWPEHSTITSMTDLNGKVPHLGQNGSGFAGRLGTRRLPKWMDALPYGDQRIKTVGRYHRAQYRAAYKVILANLPRVFRKYRILSASMGDISLDVYEPKATARQVNLPLN